MHCSKIFRLKPLEQTWSRSSSYLVLLVAWKFSILLQLFTETAFIQRSYSICGIKWFVLNHSNIRDLCFWHNKVIFNLFHMLKICLSPCKWVGARSICRLWTTVTVIKNKHTTNHVQVFSFKSKWFKLGLKSHETLLNASISLYTIYRWIKMQPHQFQPCSEMQVHLCSTMHIKCNVVLI